MGKSWDVIVVGLGGVGSAAVYHLARCGQRVLGIDAFAPAHDRGSSHGQTRLIRQAYFEHPDYVPLLKDAYHLWHQLETNALDKGEEKLFHVTGLLQVGPTNGIVLPGVLRSAKLHGQAVEVLDSDVFSNRFPQFKIEPHWSAILERNAGYLRVEACVLAHLRQASEHGAILRHNLRVNRWKIDGDGVEIETSQGTETASRLVLAAGPWATEQLSAYGVALHLRRKHQYWYAPASAGFKEADGMPCFFYETDNGYFYGCPARDQRGIKVARHDGGERLMKVGDHPHPQDEVDRELNEAFLRQYLPCVGNKLTEQVGCYYTMSADENFIVDTLPDCPQVVFVAGLSGHGFKFTSVLGKIASDLVTTGTTEHAIDFLRWRIAGDF